MIVLFQDPRPSYLNSLGRQEGGKKLFLSLLGLNCLQLKIIHISKCHILGFCIPLPLRIKPFPLCLGWSVSPAQARYWVPGFALKVGHSAENKDGTRCLGLESKEVPRNRKQRTPRTHLTYFGSLEKIHPDQNHPSSLLWFFIWRKTKPMWFSNNQ